MHVRQNWSCGSSWTWRARGFVRPRSVWRQPRRRLQTTSRPLRSTAS
uniref:Macaca fascicularis brain cDNA clone: QtrA-15048, similar to human dynactin 1 (p150, glued homolog, Drosophila) (DCTN1),transcript variant 2, mRNA, RefSeq: NM_023019.1 n=1 Tax=Macaca fascicularis TaxID=9541 RepID=I7GND7_MACFA|nr:unnamed protein product [Macaca fascicularis]